MSRVGVFASPDEAREFKQVLLQLRAAGFQIAGGQKQQAIFEAPEEFVVANTSGEIVPPFAVMQCISFDTDAIEIQKPADRYGQAGPYLINGGREIPIDGRGVGRNTGPLTIHTDGSADTALQRLSAEEDEWFAIYNPAGCWLYLGDSTLRPEGDLVFAMHVDYPQVIHAKTGSSGIAGASGSGTRSLTGGTCSLFECKRDSAIIEDSDIDETIYNTMSSSVAANTFILASRNDSGFWVVVAEDCEA